MSNLAKISIGIGITLAVVIIAGIIFLRYLVTKSYPVTNGTLELSGLHGTADIIAISSEYRISQPAMNTT